MLRHAQLRAAILVAINFAGACSQSSNSIARPIIADQSITLVPPVAPAEEERPPLEHPEQIRSLVAEIHQPLRIRVFARPQKGDPFTTKLVAVCRGVLALASGPSRLDVQNPVATAQRAEEARLLGVLPLGSKANKKRLRTLPDDQSYRALIVAVGADYLVVPQLTPERGSAEFQVAEVISRLLHGPRLVGLVTKSRSPSSSYRKLQAILDRLDVQKTSLRAPISEDLAALLVIGSEQPLSKSEAKVIASFVHRGGSVAFFIDGMKVIPQRGRYKVRSTSSGLERLFRKIGIQIRNDLVLDRACARVSVPAGVGRMLLAYPPMPIAELEHQAIIPQGGDGIHLPFPSSLTIKLQPGNRATPLLRSSTQSWTLSRRFNLSPHQQWKHSGSSGPHLLAVAIEPDQGEGPRVAVVGNARFVQDRYLQFEGNANFVRHLVEWLSGHRALSKIRP